MAAIHGARELVGPIIAMTITLIAVYAPIGIQGGLTGALFREFAFTLAGAVTVSGVVALTLSPMLASRAAQARRRTSAGSPAGSTAASTRSGRSTRACSSARWSSAWITLTVAGIAFLLIPLFYFLSTKELAPKEDQGVIFGAVQAVAELHARPDDALHAQVPRSCSTPSPKRSTPSS